MLPKSVHSTYLHAVTTQANLIGYYILFTGFPANTNIVTINSNVIMEFTPNSSYGAICPVDYAELGPYTDELCNDAFSTFDILPIASVSTAL